MKLINCKVHYGLLPVFEHEPRNILVRKNRSSHLNIIKARQNQNEFSPRGLRCARVASFFVVVWRGTVAVAEAVAVAGGSRWHPGEGVQSRRVRTPRAERGAGPLHPHSALTVAFPGAQHSEKPPSVTLAVGVPFPGACWDEGSWEFPSEIPTALVQVHAPSCLAPGTFSSQPGVSIVLFLDTPRPQGRATLRVIPQPPGDLPVPVSSCPEGGQLQAPEGHQEATYVGKRKSFCSKRTHRLYVSGPSA